MASGNSIGYGPSSTPTNQFQHLLFNGDGRKFDQWEVRIMGYLRIKKLKKVVCPEDINSLPTDDATNNELAFAEICQFLDETSLSLVMRDARDDGRKALKIIREHYAGRSKPRIITLYTELTSLAKKPNESVTDYILRAERAATSLKDAGETISDSLLVSMCLKGLPEEFKPLIVIITQKDPAYTFEQFKKALRNYEENERSRSNQFVKSSGKTNDRILKNKDGGTIRCFKCRMEGHKANVCPKRGENGANHVNHPRMRIISVENVIKRRKPWLRKMTKYMCSLKLMTILCLNQTSRIHIWWTVVRPHI